MQRGIASAIILIILAVIVGSAALFYGYFIVTNKTTPKKETVELPPLELIPSPQPKVGTTECPDTDYTGCDNTSQFMTWDGTVADEISGTTQEGTVFSK